MTEATRDALLGVSVMAHPSRESGMRVSAFTSAVAGQGPGEPVVSIQLGGTESTISLLFRDLADLGEFVRVVNRARETLSDRQREQEQMQREVAAIS